MYIIVYTPSYYTSAINSMYLNKNAIKSRFPNTLKPRTQNKNDLNTVASLLMVFSITFGIRFSVFPRYYNVGRNGGSI